MKATLILVALLLGMQSSPGRLQGLVVDALTQAPLSGVTVSFKPAARPAISVQTDQAGAFVVDSMMDGRYEMNARKEGYAFSGPTRSADNRDLGTWFTLDPGERITGLRIPMMRAGVIDGRVVDNKGRPAAGITAVTMKYRYDDEGRRNLSSLGSRRAETDDEGRFRIFGLYPGEYFVLFSAPDFTGPVSNEVFVKTYYPGTTDVSRIRSVVVDAGTEVRLSDVVLGSEPSVPVSLKVARPNGTALPDVRTIEFRRVGERGMSMLAGADAFGGPNAVTLGAVSPGVYEVAVGWEAARENYRGSTTIEVGAAGVIKGQPVVSVSPGQPLKGRVLARASDGSTQPQPGVTVAVRFGNAFTEVSAASGKDGTFTLPGIPVGQNTVRLTALPADAFVVGAQQAGRDVLRDGVVQSGDAVEVLIGTGGGIIEGVVKTSKGQPIGSALVALVPADESLRNQQHLYRSANSDQKGAFSFRGITPGSYMLFAWAQLEGAAFRNAEFLRTFDAFGVGVEVKASSKSSAELTALEIEDRAK